MLIIFWGKLQKIDLSHNNIVTYPTHFLSSINNQVELLDLRNNPIPSYELKDAQKGLDLQKITTKVIFPSLATKKEPLRKTFSLPDFIIKGVRKNAKAHIRKKVPLTLLSFIANHP